MTTIPGPRLPWEQLVWSLRLARDPAEGMRRLHQRYGPVSETRFGPLRYGFLFGPEAHSVLFDTDPDEFSWRELTKNLIPVDGETALIVSDGDDHRRRRRIVQPAFNIRRIDRHVPLMTQEAHDRIARWRAGDEVDAYQELRATVRRIVMRALFGDRLSGQADELGRCLQPALDFLDAPLPLQVHVGPRWWRARRGRARTDELVFSEIATRRATRQESDDVLTWLLEASDTEGDGGGLTDQEVRDQVISLIAAGYETTSAAVGWTVYAVLANAGIWGRLRAEVEGVFDSGPVEADVLRRLPYLDAVVSESLRLWPPGAVAGRQTLTPLSVEGFEIPAGRIVLYSPYVTQRLPEIWPDPDSFRPERWDKDAPGYAEPPGLAFVPFGAGPRRCIGFAFAITEIKVLLAELVRSVELELLLDREPGRAGLASLRPRGGVPVRVVAMR